MKLKIKVREITKGCMPEINPIGDWIDLKAADNYEFKAPQSGVLKRTQVNGETESHRDVTFDYKLLKLGVAMELPKGFEAQILPRSGTFKEFGILCANSKGIIDYPYKGNEDEWRFPALVIRDITINKGDRICQFRIVLSQKATMWQKIKWLFSSGIKLVKVDKLSSEGRGMNKTGYRNK